MYAQTPSPNPNEFTETDARNYAIAALDARAASSAKTLSMVAGFSIVNTVLGMIHAPFGLAFGLNVTDVIDYFARKSPFLGLLFDLIPVGFYLLMAFLAKKHWGWFIVAGVFYLIDGLMGAIYFLGSGSGVLNGIISTIVHCYVLYLMWQGMNAGRAARKLELENVPEPPSNRFM